MCEELVLTPLMLSCMPYVQQIHLTRTNHRADINQRLNFSDTSSIKVETKPGGRDPPCLEMPYTEKCSQCVFCK